MQYSNLTRGTIFGILPFHGRPLGKSGKIAFCRGALNSQMKEIKLERKRGTKKEEEKKKRKKKILILRGSMPLLKADFIFPVICQKSLKFSLHQEPDQKIF